MMNQSLIYKLEIRGAELSEERLFISIFSESK